MAGGCRLKEKSEADVGIVVILLVVKLVVDRVSMMSCGARGVVASAFRVVPLARPVGATWVGGIQSSNERLIA